MIWLYILIRRSEVYNVTTRRHATAETSPFLLFNGCNLFNSIALRAFPKLTVVKAVGKDERTSEPSQDKGKSTSAQPPAILARIGEKSTAMRPDHRSNGSSRSPFTPCHMRSVSSA